MRLKRIGVIVEHQQKEFAVASMVVGYTEGGIPIVDMCDATGSIASCPLSGHLIRRMIVAKDQNGYPIVMDLPSDGVGGDRPPTPGEIKKELEALGYRRSL